jgi:HD-like signal output (HDOD) protein
MNKKILLVDDEKQILGAFRRLFCDSNYEIFLADSGEKALEILENRDMNLLITDIRMPLMDGYQLLKKVRNQYPYIIRVILSGYTDREDLIKSIQSNLARACLYKPWDNKHVLSTIDKLFLIEESLNSNPILSVLRDSENLPTIKNMSDRIVSLLSESVSQEKICESIEQDQSLTSNILRIANATFYGDNIGSINQSVNYLGMENVKNIIITNEIFSCFDDLERELLWRHSSLTNKLVTLFHKKILSKKVANCYSAGLLHDIGEVVFLRFFSDKYKVVKQKANSNRNSSIISIEKDVIGISHQEMGGFLLNMWGLPCHIVETALFHHTPLDENVINKDIVCLVNIADYYACRLLERSGDIKHLDDKVFDYVNITRRDCERLICEFSSKDTL